LRKEGYLVLQAESGKAAIDAAAQAGRIDVLLTDVAMPGMSGIDVASILWRTQRDMRVIVMSGHPRHLVSLPKLHIPVEFLAKPFTPHELRQRLHAVLADVTDQPSRPLPASTFHTSRCGRRSRSAHVWEPLDRRSRPWPSG